MAGEVADIVLMTDKLPQVERAQSPEGSFASLVERARAGDAAAFEQVMICTQRRVASVAWRMLGNREDSRDATQEVFLRAYKYLASYKPEQDFHGWLYRITVNVCRDLARRRGAAGQGVELTSFETERGRGALETIAGNDDSEEAAVLAQRRRIVALALATLPEKERAAIVLRDLEGLSTEEVARALGSTPATVRSQISTARTKLKDYCSRYLQQRRQV